MSRAAEPAPLRLIVGLGNPGPRYADTRHNAGFWYVDAVAREYGGQFRPEGRFSAEVARVRIDGHELWLLKPQSFMNRSGLPVRRFLQFYKLDTAHMLVAHDELDLPPGAARLKQGGGHGGHNGLRDLFAHVGRDFWRLRIGIGHPGQRGEVVDYVLHRPGAAEQQAIDSAIAAALAVTPLLAAGRFPLAMNRLHAETP